MRYFNLIISGGNTEIKEYATEAERDTKGTEEMAELHANSGLFDDAVYPLDSEAPITIKDLRYYPTPDQIAQKKEERRARTATAAT